MALKGWVEKKTDFPAMLAHYFIFLVSPMQLFSALD